MCITKEGIAKAFQVLFIEGYNFDVLFRLSCFFVGSRLSFCRKKYFVVDSGEKKLSTPRPWDFAWCINFAFVYTQLCRRRVFFLS